MTMYFSHMSGINVGVITTIWSVQPLIAAIIDWIVYRQQLGFHHIIGMILVILGAIAIGTTGIAKNKENLLNIEQSRAASSDGMAYHPVLQDQQSPTWIALLWGFITPCFFLAQSFYTKYITSPRFNFCARTVCFGSSATTSFIVLIVGVSWYWRKVHPLDPQLFLIGIAASMVDTVGNACLQTAFSKGPAGPITAMVEMNNVFLVVLDAVRTNSMPT